MNVAALDEESLLGVGQDTEALFAAAGGEALGFLAIVGDRPDVTFGDEQDETFRSDGKIGVGVLGGDFADAARGVGEVNLYFDGVFGFLEFKFGFGGAGGFAGKGEDVETVAVAGALEEEILAVGRPGGLAVVGVEAGDIDGFAAGGRDDPDVEGTALAAARVGDPFAVGDHS